MLRAIWRTCPEEGARGFLGSSSSSTICRKTILIPPPLAPLGCGNRFVAPTFRIVTSASASLGVGARHSKISEICFAAGIGGVADISALVGEHARNGFEKNRIVLLNGLRHDRRQD